MLGGLEVLSPNDTISLRKPQFAHPANGLSRGTRPVCLPSGRCSKVPRAPRDRHCRPPAVWEGKPREAGGAGGEVGIFVVLSRKVTARGRPPAAAVSGAVSRRLGAWRWCHERLTSHGGPGTRLR